MGISKEEFYDEELVGILPMGFCYPGKGISGDLPPRKECEPKWHQEVLSEIENVKLTLLIGSFAQKHYLGDQLESTLTKTVQNFDRYLPRYLVLPHPSPRNNIWQAKNPWFKAYVLPELKSRVSIIIDE